MIFVKYVLIALAIRMAPQAIDDARALVKDMKG